MSTGFVSYKGNVNLSDNKVVVAGFEKNSGIHRAGVRTCKGTLLRYCTSAYQLTHLRLFVYENVGNVYSRGSSFLPSPFLPSFLPSF